MLVRPKVPLTSVLAEKIDAMLTHLKASGIRLIDQTPRKGAHHTRVAFIHPSATHGVLVELVEHGE